LHLLLLKNCIYQELNIIIIYFAYSVQRSVNGLKNETEMHELKVRTDSFPTLLIYTMNLGLDIFTLKQESRIDAHVTLLLCHVL
jgi:hypothetical protein